MASAVSKRSRKRAREVPDSGSDSARSDTPTRKGRPTTTGKYAGIGLSRREAAAATKAAAAAVKQMEDERQIAALTKRVVEGRATPRSESSDSAALEVEAEELPASDLNRRMTDAVAAIKRVGKVSKGLSGCSQKALKEATASILECAQVLLTRTDTEETALLRAQNTRLAAQVEALRKEHLELKAEMANFRREHLRREVGLLSATPDATPQPQQQQQSPQETELVRLIRQEMASFNARFSVLEGRILRPPLAADQRSAPAPTYAAKAAAPRATQPAQAAAAKKGKSKAAKKASAAHAAAPQAAAPRVTQPDGRDRPASRNPPSTPDAEWKVAGDAKKKKKEARQRAKKEAHKKKEEGVAAATRRPARLRTPRSTAVALTLQPGAEERGLSYADILAKAKAEISLSDLGITGLRCKTTATGGRLLEVSGATSGPKADALAEKLRASLGSDDVRVSRPTKCAVLRISGLDDSATIEEVVAAVSKTGGCPPDQVKAGTIRHAITTEAFPVLPVSGGWTRGGTVHR
ncbi:translation initiation factor IF-2-like [Vanessa cardui]|uniref:translation initiation factor IF-2-like n=1 Tax=Vanessa cardui TaxID=171605 RepID=UPI001F129CFD|nr:translation initiation factor IF-2-like [Vanessa cardui]XP_046978126.1 translation initiation factor IF-2-like [Vanessa cardui]